MKNISELKKMHDDFVDMVIDNSPLAYVVMDKDHNVVYANDYVCKVLGYEVEEIIGRKCYDWVNAGSPCQNCAVKKAIAANGKHKILKEEISKSGQTRYNDIIAVPLFKPDGTFDYIMEIVQDRTYEVSLQKQTEKDFYSLVESFSGLIEVNDEYTGNHSKNVKDISIAIADALNLDDQSKRELFVGSYLHDIGKIGIPDRIINKEGKLTDEEYETIKSHPVIGGNILKNITSFKNVNIIVRNHHERFDGKGYPDGLKGDELPLLGRIVSVADTFDAMTTTRSYRPALSINIARAELIKYSGIQFDPQIVKVLVHLIDSGKLFKTEADASGNPAYNSGVV